MCKALKMKQSFHTPYQPMGGADVEHSNKTLKEKLTKALLSEQGSWVDHLPAVLMTTRAAANARTHLSPFEIAMGRPMRVLGAPISQLELWDLQGMGDKLLNYCKQLTLVLSTVSSQVKEAHRRLPQDWKAHSLQLGDEVYMKVHQPGTLSAEVDRTPHCPTSD